MRCSLARLEFPFEFDPVVKQEKRHQLFIFTGTLNHWKPPDQVWIPQARSSHCNKKCADLSIVSA